MARLCIRITPNDHPTDPSLTPLRTGEGDVVALVDDGHVFSQAELTNGHYRILDLPGVPQEDLIHLVAHESDAQGRMTKRRMLHLNPALLKAGIWIGRTTATQAQLAAITRARP
jgi:hypothetical protein